MTAPAIPEHDYLYDVETYINYFCCTVIHIASGTRWIYEIKPTLNQTHELVILLFWLRENGCRMVGFNNARFDYPILHELLRLYQVNGYATAEELYWKAQEIFRTQDDFANRIWPSDWYVDQLDLFMIHHFDNRAKTTSLKALEFNMRSPIVADLPYPASTLLTPDQMAEILNYNCNDVSETKRLYIHTLPMIVFRDELTAKTGERHTNYNDTKIGKRTLIRRLEAALPGVCYGPDRKPRQTQRDRINFGEIILPYIRFQHPEFVRVHQFLFGAAISGYDTNSPEILKGLSARVRDFQFDFGAGGIHGSVNETIVRADADHELIDIDVKSYYPNIAIVNRLYPEHLTDLFCDIYSDLYQERAKLPKKSSESAMLKLALNGVYGDSNQIYSPFYDPAYTMAITINGQLLLCMLAEWLLMNAGIVMIQINTDGMTVRVHRDVKHWFEWCCQVWQQWTGLELESANYSAMFIRDVNNYIAVDTKGGTKRKGEYQWFTGEPNNVGVSRAWHQDWSALVVPKAVEAVLTKGADLGTFIRNHDDPFDFMIRAKVPRTSKLVLTAFGIDRQQQNLTRYYIAKNGGYLFKLMPPLATSKTGEPRRIAIDKGWSVMIANDLTHGAWQSWHVDHRYYIGKAEKLLGMMK